MSRCYWIFGKETSKCEKKQKSKWVDVHESRVRLCIWNQDQITILRLGDVEETSSADSLDIRSQFKSKIVPATFTVNCHREFYPWEATVTII